MTGAERRQVYGDDIWFRTAEGVELTGQQIQVMDTTLAEGQLPLGETVYGHGNCGKGDEGARKEGLFFTNCLGPVLVRNPEFAAQLICRALAARGVEVPAALPEDAIETELRGRDMLKQFVQPKMEHPHGIAERFA